MATRSTTAALALAAVAALALGTANAQDKPVALKLSSWVPAQHALNPALQAWADDIKKQSNGTITSTLFPSEQLGKAFDHYDMARDGIADFAYVNPGYQPGRFPIFAGASLPFLFANAKHTFTSFISCAAYCLYQSLIAAVPPLALANRNGSEAPAMIGKRPGW